MGIIIDTNVFTKILVGDTHLADKLWELSGSSHLVIPDPVEAEVRVFCNLTKNPTKSLKAFNNLIDQLECQILSCTKPAWDLAAEKFASYLERRDPEKLQCPQCGFASTFTCPQCGALITARQHLLMDFLIGAFAELDPDKSLCTSDQGVFKTYFPDLSLI